MIETELLRDIAKLCSGQLFVTEAVLGENGLEITARGRARVMMRMISYEELTAGGFDFVKGQVAVLIGSMERAEVDRMRRA